MKIEEQTLGVENGVRILFKKWAKREPTQQELDELKDVKTVAETEARIIFILAREAYLAGKTLAWIKEGKALRQARDELRLSQKRCSQGLGIGTKTLKKLEDGQYIRNRRVVVISYDNFLELEVAKINALFLNKTIRQLKK